MRTFVCVACVILSIFAHVSADGAVKPELNDESKQVLAKVQSLREQEKNELEKIEKKDERDLVETMAIEAEVKDLKAGRPKRDTPTDLFAFLKPKAVEAKPDKARQARQASLKSRVRRNKQRRAAAAARRNAKLNRTRRNRTAAREARARLIRRVQRAKINQSNKKAAAAKKADQLKKE